MAVSLGMRISGLLVAGALAIATAAACGSGGGDDASGSGGGGTSVSGGVADGGGGGGQKDGGLGGGTPTWVPPEENGDGGSGGSGGSGSGGSGSGGSGSGGSASGGSVGTNGSGGSGGSNSGSGQGPGSGSSDSGGSSGGPEKVEGPAWLPPGPRSPNTDVAPDPASVYDTIGEAPSACAGTAKEYAKAKEPEWQVLRGLASACAAVQGQGGSWDTATADYSRTQGELTSCKGLAAYEVLGNILEFHRRHPSATVQLKGSKGAGGGAACAFRVASVNVEKAKPGDTIRITFEGIHFGLTKQEVEQIDVTITDGDQEAEHLGDQPELEPGGPVLLDVVVPKLKTGPYPKTVSITATYGPSATLNSAFTVLAPDPTGPTDSSSSATPSVTP
ncbi:hypothetical protein GCM10022232_79560 [Streptomyces plumbiresistens]|uniref:Secreted protein n=1 Tax=Streptomyces plumbiresistens TaxID=511811 RepID=A0ABP7T8H0_9ACTN